MINKIFRVIALLILIAVLAVMGTCAYQLWKSNNPDTGPEPPKIEDAYYQVKFIATGRIIFTNTVERIGNFVLVNGYWEANKKKYIYKDIILKLDENIFGEISIERR